MSYFHNPWKRQKTKGFLAFSGGWGMKYWNSGVKRVNILTGGGSRTDATSKMERFVIIVNGWKPLTIITKRSILDVAAVLDLPLLDEWSC